MKKIKLLCQTGGCNYGDVVDIPTKTITVEIAESLVNEGLAEAIEVSEVAVAAEVQPRTKATKGKK